MWGRVIELMMAVWMVLSPFIFRAQDESTAIFIDLGFASAIAVLAGCSYWHPTRHAHFFILVVGVGMAAWGRFSGGMPPTPADQNHIFVGLFLLLIALIPNQASRPPVAWQTKAAS